MAKDDLELLILLPLPAELWGHRGVLPCFHFSDYHLMLVVVSDDGGLGSCSSVHHQYLI